MRYRDRIAVALAAVVFLWAIPASAQEKPAPPPSAPISIEKPPVLTDVQKLTLQLLAQRIEIAQLRYQAAQREFDAAKDEITKLIQALTVPGYDLDLMKLEYTRKPAPEKKQP